MEKLQQANSDMGDYDSLASTAKKTQETDSPKQKERPVPKPRPGTFVIESPTEETPKDPYGYSKPQKEKIEDIDRYGRVHESCWKKCLWTLNYASITKLDDILPDLVWLMLLCICWKLSMIICLSQMSCKNNKERPRRWPCSWRLAGSIRCFSSVSAETVNWGLVSMTYRNDLKFSDK